MNQHIILTRRMTHTRKSYDDLQFIKKVCSEQSGTQAAESSIYRMALKHAAQAFRTQNKQTEREYSNKGEPASQSKIEHTLASYQDLTELMKLVPNKARIQISTDCLYRLALEMLAEAYREHPTKKATKRKHPTRKETLHA